MRPSARARRLVEARLGRAPQDALEAAVVLEAWAGVPAPAGARDGPGNDAASARGAAGQPAAPVAPQRPPGMALEGAAFLVTVVAIALWAEPLAAALGVGAVERALELALPLTLGAAVGAARRATWAAPPASPAWRGGAARWPPRPSRRGGGPALLFGHAGRSPALLTVTWTGGTHPDPARVGGRLLRHRGGAVPRC